MENEVLKTIGTAVANNCGAMGAETILKHGRMSKSQMSRSNKFFIAVIFLCVCFTSFGQREFNFYTGQGEDRHVTYNIYIDEDNSDIFFLNFDTNISYSMLCEQIPYKGGSIDKYLHYKGYIYQKYDHNTKVRTPFKGTMSKVEISMTPPLSGQITMWITLLGKTLVLTGYEKGK